MNDDCSGNNKIGGIDGKFEGKANPNPPCLCKTMYDSGLFKTEDLVIENVETWIDLIKEHLYSKGYEHAVATLDKMLDYNEGLKRKDGKTPSIVHELTQLTWLISCLDDGLIVENPEGVIINDIAHDLGEDHGMKPYFLIKLLLAYQPVEDKDTLTEIKAAHGVLSKDYLGEESEKIPTETLFKLIAASQNASIVKILDRIHNISTHIGVKTAEKSASYVKSTREKFIPAIREISTELFLNQTEIYDMLLEVLEATCALTEMHYKQNHMPTNDTLRSLMPEAGFKDLPDGLNPFLVIANRSRATRNEQTPSTDNSSDLSQ